MDAPQVFRYRWLLGALSIVSLALSYWFMFRAGCAGDLKGGSLGDPRRAVELANTALPFFVFGIAGPLAVIASLRHLPILQRFGIASFSLIFGGPLLWFFGIQFEVWGVQHCFP